MGGYILLAILAPLVIGGIVWGVRLYLQPAPWDESQDNDE